MRFFTFTLPLFYLFTFTLPLSSEALTRKEILAQAQPYLPQLDSLLNEYWPEGTCKHFIAGQIEQETCASVRQCWNSNTELKTSREYGFGLGQITIAFNKDGSERFNNFIEAKKKYHQLKDWGWDNRFNVTYQLTYIVLSCKALFEKFMLTSSYDIDVYASSFVGYNAGTGTVMNRRALCKLTIGCDCEKWFGGLNSVHLKSEEALLYGVQLYKRRNDYPYNIIYLRAQKYEQYFDHYE